eukprot:scaffold183461_cov18-Prasinocladus_malaysianus.AAC.1
MGGSVLDLMDILEEQTLDIIALTETKHSRIKAERSGGVALAINKNSYGSQAVPVPTELQSWIQTALLTPAKVHSWLLAAVYMPQVQTAVLLPRDIPLVNRNL